MSIVVFLFFMIGAVCATVFTGKVTRVLVTALLGAWSIFSLVLAFKLYGAQGAEGAALFPVPGFVVSGFYFFTSFAWAFILLSWKRHALYRIAAVFVTFRRRQHEISKVDRTVFSDVGVASENGK